MTSPRAHRPTVRWPIALLAAAVLATGCGNGTSDTSRFQEDLDTQAQAQAAMRQRIDDLEALLAAEGTSGEAALSGLREQLDGLIARLDELSQSLAGEASAREDADAEATAALTSLEEVLGSLQTAVETLRTQLQDLQDDHELLRAQFENHADHG